MAAHERFWQRARRRLGDGAGTRALIEALLLRPPPALRRGARRAHAVERIGRRWTRVLLARHSRRAASPTSSHRESAVVERPALQALRTPGAEPAGYDALLAASTQ